MIEHIVIITGVANRAAVYGSNEELAYFGTTVAAQPPLIIDGGEWGRPAKSTGPPVVFAWGVWASALRTCPGSLLVLKALAVAGTIHVFVFDPVAVPETFDAYTARWKAAVNWVDAQQP